MREMLAWNKQGNGAILAHLLAESWTPQVGRMVSERGGLRKCAAQPAGVGLDCPVHCSTEQATGRPESANTPTRPAHNANEILVCYGRGWAEDELHCLSESALKRPFLSLEPMAYMGPVGERLEVQSTADEKPAVLILVCFTN